MRDLKGLWRFPGDFLQTFSNGTVQPLPTILGGQFSHAAAHPYDSERIVPFVDIAQLFAER